MPQRLVFIDIAKVIGIYLVVLGHYVYYLQLPFIPSTIWDIEHFVTLFHMPLFFLISGILYKERPFKDVLEKVSLQLLKPYIYICLICLFLGSAILFLKNSYVEIGFICKNLLGIASGADLYSKGFISFSGPLWFCYSLLEIKVFLSFIERFKIDRNKLMLIFAFVGGGGMMFIGNKFPFRVD